ncbi:MAG: diacylglucosamine hydrolase like protein [Helicobacteraceae bacterium]|nr:diacylglucosamine hydrolase like protein [Helicobacteraceae bacterium]
MLVHICCSVDSHFFLERLQQDFPNEKLTAFFYNPNIHPYSEYYLRLLDVQRSCKLLNVELHVGEYDFESWFKTVKGLENEPEKGKRCELCFDTRFEVSASKAKELNHTTFTSTLLVSPLKSQEQLKSVGAEFLENYGVEFIAIDYRSNGGTQEQSRVTKEQKLYRQDYCGCIYGLRPQRDKQNIYLSEMVSHISKETLEGSIEQRVELYEKRLELEDQNLEYKIIKENFLNYRELNSKVTFKKEVIDAYFFNYSILKSKKAQGRVEFEHNNIHYFNRNNIKFITLEFFNSIANKKHQNIKDIIYNPPLYSHQIELREALTGEKNTISPIIVLETIPTQKMTVQIESTTYEDTKERFLIIN